MLVEGELVTYKDIQGEIVFACESSVSISINESNNVRIVVSNWDFDKIICLNQK